MTFLDRFREVKEPSPEDIQNIQSTIKKFEAVPYLHEDLQANRARGLGNFAADHLVMRPREAQMLQDDAIAKQETGEMPVVQLPENQ